VYDKIYLGIDKGHDEHRKAIIRGPLYKLIENCGIRPDDIIDVWEGKDPVMKAVINGPVGADRMVQPATIK
jgi:HD superfamily phosphohydrolase